MPSKGHARPAYVGTKTERLAQDSDQLATGTLWIQTSGDTGDPSIYFWTGTGWARILGTDNDRTGEITPAGVAESAGYGKLLYFSGGPQFGAVDSENSDPLWIARYNVASDDSELRVNIGDNQEADDALAVGTSPSGVWTEVFRVSSNGTVIFTQNSEPADAELGNSEFTFWLDDTPGATVLNIKAKDSGGTVRAATVALA